ncbi:MAG: CoA-binding protein [Peptococcaceae bacterium]|nr:CoA-binding protein [Peptococcaceae bacterium]
MARVEHTYTFTGELTTGHRFAVIGRERSFRKHQHAWKAWRALKDFGCVVYPVALKVTRLGNAKVYPDLASLTDKIDVAVPCLPPEEIPDLVALASGSGCSYIWFQEQSWKEEFQEQCERLGVKAVRGCVLLHKIYRRPFGFFHPCYWHGWRADKVPLKR